MNFIGRKNELKKLDQMFLSDRQEVTLIYGRRRIGKSELIKQFLLLHPDTGVYYECKHIPELSHVASLSQIISDRFHLLPLAFDTLEALLDSLFQQACRDKFILVLDEYTYLRETITGLDSILQALIDKYAQQSKMKLVLCGSFVETMRGLQFANNPLYGRIDLTIELQPMDYYESAAFYPSFSAADKVRLYSIFGGIPYYNSLIDPGKTVRENMIDLLASPGARLEDEVMVYLHSEFSNMTNVNAVFVALAQGFSRFSDILAQSHISRNAALSDILKKLMRIGMVDKVAPINDSLNKKRTRYVIKDNLACFYYRYLFGYASQLRIMEAELFYDRYIKQDFEQNYVPQQFKTICRDYLIRKNRQGKLSIPFEAIGNYCYTLFRTHQNGEFDIVTHDDHGDIFYEAMFGKDTITEQMMEHEIKQVNATGLHCYRYGFFSQAGCESCERPDIITYDLQDLYEPPAD